VFPLNRALSAQGMTPNARHWTGVDLRRQVLDKCGNAPPSRHREYAWSACAGHMGQAGTLGYWKVG
jgi:hypothetical protein